MMKKILVLLLVGTALLISACGQTATATPTPSPFAENVVAQGSVEPSAYVDVSFSALGQVAEVLVAEGATVKAGDVLARLSGSELRQADLARAKQALLNAQQALNDLKSTAELNKAQAQATVADAQKAVEKAQDDYDTVKDGSDETRIAQAEAKIDVTQALLKLAQGAQAALKDGINPEKLAAAQAAYESAQASVASAEAALKSLELVAPINGTIINLTLKAGQFIGAGQPALTIADLSNWLVKTDDLTELDVARVSVGQAVTLELDALPGQTLNGAVAAIAQRAVEKRGDVTYTVTITLTNPTDQIRWGMSGQVRFEK